MSDYECQNDRDHLWRKYDHYELPAYIRFDDPSLVPFEVCLKCWKRRAVHNSGGNNQLTYN